MLLLLFVFFASLNAPSLNKWFDIKMCMKKGSLFYSPKILSFEFEFLNFMEYFFSFHFFSAYSKQVHLNCSDEKKLKKG